MGEGEELWGREGGGGVSMEKKRGGSMSCVSGAEDDCENGHDQTM